MLFDVDTTVDGKDDVRNKKHRNADDEINVTSRSERKRHRKPWHRQPLRPGPSLVTPRDRSRYNSNNNNNNNNNASSLFI